MLGYIRAYKPDMTFSQFDIYKGVYCSLCKVIGKRYGLLARMTLSYDFTFFALVRLGLNTDKTEFYPSRCSFNPIKKCYKCSLQNEDLVITADISMLTVYYKYIDNLTDTHGLKHFALKLLSPYFNHIRKKAMKNCPEADEILKELNLNQAEAEMFNKGIDYSADPSAKALGKLLCLKKDYEDIDILQRFGYTVGRWVYIMDAVDDYKDDIKKGRFNPFSNISENDFLSLATNTVNLTAGETARLFEELKINYYKPILANIIYNGMYYSMLNTIKKRSEKPDDKSL